MHALKIVISFVAVLTLSDCCRPFASTAWADGGELELTVVDRETQQPIACRIHLKNNADKPRMVKSLPWWHDHFVFDGVLPLELARGTYKFEIERGPEYVNSYGHFTLERDASDSKTVELKRGVDMAKAGWWSADLDARRPTKDLKLLMLADDLHVLPGVALADKKKPGAAAQDFNAGPVLFNDDRVYDLRGARDDRDGGPLLLLRLSQPFVLQGPRYRAGNTLREMLGLEESPEVWIDVPQPSAWDLPMWLAAGGVDSIELANSQLCRPPAKAIEAAGKPRDARRFQGPQALGLWSQYIYYQVLNSGLRIPPSAGSGTGQAQNPLGYNRMYVYLGDGFSYERWWDAFRAGKVIVTNGPLLQPRVQGQRPGHVFQAKEGDSLSLQMSLSMTTRDPISYLELVKNGEVERTVRMSDYADKKGELPALTFDKSGWFLVRAVTDVGETYRFASTGPYYVEIGEKKNYVSKTSAKFFLTWLEERIAMLEKAKKGVKPDLTPFEKAREFWKARLAEANAD
jgi:hypothetical protein